MEKQCLLCGKIIHKKRNISLKEWNTKTKFCSKKCFGLWRRGKRYGKETEFKKGQTPWNFKVIPDTYTTIHKRIRKLFGVPDRCELCGSDAMARDESFLKK